MAKIQEYGGHLEILYRDRIEEVRRKSLCDPKVLETQRSVLHVALLLRE